MRDQSPDTDKLLTFVESDEIPGRYGYYLDPFGERFPDAQGSQNEFVDRVILNRACRHIIALERQVARLTEIVNAMQGDGK